MKVQKGTRLSHLMNVNDKKTWIKVNDEWIRIYDISIDKNEEIKVIPWQLGGSQEILE